MVKHQAGNLRESGRRIRRGILKMIADKTVGSNGQLPHLHDLAARFDVSYACASRTIRQLKHEGRVAVFAGKGVFAIYKDVPKVVAPHHIRLGPNLASLLSNADIQALRRRCPSASIEIASSLSDRDADLGLVDAESVLIRIHRGPLTPAADLGMDRAGAEALGVDPCHLDQMTMNGKLYGVPVAVNPLLLGVRADLLDEAVEGLHGPDGRVSLERLSNFTIRHTVDSDAEAQRKSGFDFANHTSHTHALTRAEGGRWDSAEAFYGETSLRALRRVWELIHKYRTCLLLVSSATPVTRLDVWKMDRVAMLFAKYHEVSSLLHTPRAFNAAGRSIMAWGGEPSRYLCLCGKPTVRPELFQAAAEIMAESRMQVRILRRGWGLPSTCSRQVWEKAGRLLGRQCDVLREIIKMTYNPYRVDGSPEDFWQAEYAVRDYLADLYQIGAPDAAAVARRRENTLMAERHAHATVLDPSSGRPQ